MPRDQFTVERENENEGASVRGKDALLVQSPGVAGLIINHPVVGIPVIWLSPLFPELHPVLW